MARRQGLLPAAALLLATACAPEQGAGTPPAPAPPAPPPSRVVVLGPSTAETIFALGLGEKVVGVSDYCVAPGAAGLPRLGGQWNPSLERIAALEPDLVVTQGRFPRLEAVLRDQGVGHLALATDTWDSWEEEVRTLGELFQVPERAADLVAASRAALEEVRRQAAARAEPPVPVLLVVGRRPGQAAGLVVAGGASFLTTLLEAAGGRNVFADNPRNYFDLDEEALVRAAPEVILELQPGRSADREAILRIWRQSFPGLPAVAAGRVRVLTEDFLLLPGPRMPEVAAILAEALRPR